MKDDYLWDGSGEPDPEIQRLERILGRFRHDRPAPKLPQRAGAWAQLRFWLWSPVSAVALAALVIVASTWLFIRRAGPVREPKVQSETDRRGGLAGPGPAWDVTRLEGSVKIGAARLGNAGRLAQGEWLETDEASRVKINVAKIGQVELEPQTRLQLVETRSNLQHLALARGTIRATIWAPPGQFVVDTPSAMAVDLGCAYTLHVDEKGAGLLRVTFGWVAFKLGDREAFIPEGAVCATRPGSGPGTPYYEDTSKAFQAALEKLDFEQDSAQSRAEELGVVLKEARKRDALSLWHLLARVEGIQRERVYERLAALVPPLQGVSREGILRGDRRMRDLWWNQLGLQDMAWWRQWESAWPDQPVRSKK